MTNTETEAATTEAGLITAVSKIAREVKYADFHSTPDACPLGTLAAGLNYGDLRVIADALSRHTEKPSTPAPVTVEEVGKIIRHEMQNHSIPAVQRSERAAKIILSASLVLPPSVEKIAEIICDGTVASCCKKNPEKYSPCTTENCRPTRQAQAILSLITKAGAVEPADQEESAWLIEDSHWDKLPGGPLYVHKDFDAARWRAETDRVADFHRRKEKFNTKDPNEAMRFPTKEAAETWLGQQPKFVSAGGNIAREHCWPLPPADQSARIRELEGLVERAATALTPSKLSIEGLDPQDTSPNDVASALYEVANELGKIIAELRAAQGVG